MEASRRIEAPAELIFSILSTPQRHVDIDGSGMLRGALSDRPISSAGETFTMKMHRMGDDYLMINHVVEFELNRRLFWEPAPGDTSRSINHDAANIGVPAGYRWGYLLSPDGPNATVVTEVFDAGTLADELFRDGGSWINGKNSVLESMATTLLELDKICTT